MPPTRDSNGAVIPRAKRNADGEDVSRALVTATRRRPDANTSSKAIIQRHGRHGIWGDGQMSFIRKLSGQEKLALKADEIMNTAVSLPFRLAELQSMAESELINALDLISNLHDPEFFYDDISNLIASRPKLKPDLLTAPFVGKTISSRIHNAYLLAASWKVVSNVLQDLKARDLQDANVRKQLTNSVHMRDAYLLVVDTIAMLSSLVQQELSLAVVGSNELGFLFTSGKNAKSFSTVDSANVMAVHRSLIDTVIIELVLPESRYPPTVLVAVLRDALDTTPKEEAKKFSQAVFDALGDLSLLIDFQNMLLGPLYGEQGEKWLKAPRKEASGEIDEFFDAIAQSLNASSMYSRWQSWAFPLRKVKSQAQLDDMWNQINTVYVEATGHSIDNLWRLESDRQTTPRYSTWFIPEFAMYASDIESDSEYPFPPGLSSKSKKKAKEALVRAKRRNETKSGSRKAIRNDGDDDDYDDDMPALMSVSDSSEESNGEFGPADSDDNSDDNDDDESEAEESDWEGHERRTMNALLAEAMKQFQTGNGKFDDGDKKGGSFASNKVNPFLRMLKGFSGRVFNTDPTFRPQKLGERPVFGPPRPPPEPPKPKGAPASGSKTQTTGMTVEDTDDEDDIKDDKKKKKKKKKKPKKKTTAEESEEIEALDTVETPVTSPQLPSVNPTSPTVPVGKTAKQAPSRKSTDTFGGSTTSLPITAAPSTARSAHSYLGGKEAEPKVKVKTRADTDTSRAIEKTKSFFSNYTRKGKERKEKDKKKEEEDKEKEVAKADGKEKAPKERRGVFQVPNKVAKLLGRVLGAKDDETVGQAGIRWEHFEKAMRKMGFTIKHSSQGSRVTFLPPNPKDPSVVFHKPHPNPTIYPILLKEIRKTLQKHYGWEPDHFEEQLAASAGLAFDDQLD